MSLLYKIPSYQSIFDALVTIKVPLDSIVSVLGASDLDLDSELTGEEIAYEETQIEPPKGGQIPVFAPPVTSAFITNSAQNIFDICLMTLSDINKIVLLTSSNSEIFNSINSSVDGVKAVNYNNSDITDSGLILAFKKSNINITTGDIMIETGFLLQEDGFYILQEDGFKIEL